MFTFFSKKEYLVDHLSGLIDIHNHILPGIDDGAKTVEESIDLIKSFGEFGIKDFICTPHIMSGYYENTPETIKKSFIKLRKELEEKKIVNANLSYAAEHMIDSSFDELLENNMIIPLNSSHILIEMSYLQPSINFEASIGLIKNRGYFPIFAHPERYQYLNNDIRNYYAYKPLGIKLQLNLLSLGGHYGKEPKQTSLKLLEMEKYDFLGSDVHNIEHLDTLKEIKIQPKVLDEIYRLKSNNQLFFTESNSN
ncbi:tyrosine-protein phosphatase [Croceitalea rosinachiae]|uniref:protein-tyrosine-phosphatase n=1 Tax=Croceitalea rosinachiae TaxID=3075596 RepID=A0ABU3ACB5_9FLAO|nr:CpsB/CapC family capsule biosynthesis tyrosine phosphatase [Croceitalea sp. F388]MDT0607819.1 CpsB/CapC family capsule biosynthesis tyrosine phosphatase [Croceitalea sp. F388]